MSSRSELAHTVLRREDRGEGGGVCTDEHLYTYIFVTSVVTLAVFETSQCCILIWVAPVSYGTVFALNGRQFLYYHEVWVYRVRCALKQGICTIDNLQVILRIVWALPPLCLLHVHTCVSI